MNKNNLKWNFILQYGYLITHMFNGVFLLPFYVKNIDAVIIGLWLTTGNVLAWLTMADPGIGDVLQQKISELKGMNQNEEIGRTIGSGYISSVFIGILSVLMSAVFYYSVHLIIHQDIEKYPDLQLAFLISLVSTCITLLSFTMSGINLGMQNSSGVAKSYIISNLVFLLVNILLLNLKFGVISIAIANLTRAMFLAIYNFLSIQYIIRKEHLTINYDLVHFRKFIKVFSFTSGSKLITSISNNIDLIILARFVPAQMITSFEINRSPIKISQGLVGRYSLAIMPTISHAKGVGNMEAVDILINKHLKFYSLAVWFSSCLLWLCYEHLIILWMGPNQYAGDSVMFLMVGGFLFSTLGYFMSNIGYAFGDFKINSLINIFRGVTFVGFSWLGAKNYGIIGFLVVSLVIMVFVDFLIFSFRVIRSRRIRSAKLKSMAKLFAVVVPFSIVFGLSINYLVSKYLLIDNHFVELILIGSTFSIISVGILYVFDRDTNDFIAKNIFKKQLFTNIASIIS